ncbi:aminotransferase class IV [Engelhardtia mirabilis]|uniref:branched-chain-amino-acid transaminase n=1 Tax=Engelhardtia mirabilis TaxID=2528011 RepID=A0A518BM51_9BACT|nr:D-alanine aminotransferase [Planctomycetes bacterium Pla133]QDV02353.1 D-alanine aminotransferase [Planctomycetes bacterium Pla86]
MSDPTDRGAAWPVVLQGELVPADAARVSIADPALRLGIGLFETLALRGVPRLVDAHLQRLARSARSLGLDLPDLDGLADGIERLAEALPVDRAALRLTVSPRAAPGTRWWIEARPLPERPARVVLWPAGPVVRPGDLLEQIKHTGRLGKVLMRERAVARGAHDALLATTDGDWVEATVANLWVVVDGRLRTPPSCRGCLPGVARATLLADDRPILPTEVAAIAPAELARASEILLTNSLQGVLAVDEVLGLGLDLPGAAGPVAAALQRRFEELEVGPRVRKADSGKDRGRGASM